VLLACLYMVGTDNKSNNLSRDSRLVERLALAALKDRVCHILCRQSLNQDVFTSPAPQRVLAKPAQNRTIRIASHDRPLEGVRCSDDLHRVLHGHERYDFAPRY